MQFIFTHTTIDIADDTQPSSASGSLSGGFSKPG